MEFTTNDIRDWYSPGMVVDVDADWCRANVDLEEAQLTYISRHCLTGKVGADGQKIVSLPPYGTWSLNEFGEMAVLVDMPIKVFIPSEGEWGNALNYASTIQYIEWFRAGHMPPPLAAVRNVNGSIFSLNRRRWLAAREAGWASLPVWFSETHPVHRSRSLWYLPEMSEVKRAQLRLALENGKDLSQVFSQYELDSFAKTQEASR